MRLPSGSAPPASGPTPHGAGGRSPAPAASAGAPGPASGRHTRPASDDTSAPSPRSPGPPPPPAWPWPTRTSTCRSSPTTSSGVRCLPATPPLRSPTATHNPRPTPGKSAQASAEPRLRRFHNAAPGLPLLLGRASRCPNRTAPRSPDLAGTFPCLSIRHKRRADLHHARLRHHLPAPNQAILFLDLGAPDAPHGPNPSSVLAHRGVDLEVLSTTPVERRRCAC